MELGNKKTMVVFSHPNHELPIYGIIQRFRPRVVFLTDGGTRERVEETLNGFGRIKLIYETRFLNFKEPFFYEGLVGLEVSHFREVAGSLQYEIEKFQPEQILCDAVEFYNPVHDMTLPIVLHALKGLKHIPIFEVPLIYQRQAVGEEYEVQRAVPSRRNMEITLKLSPKELQWKVLAWENVYTILSKQMGAIVRNPKKTGATEVVLIGSVPGRRPLDRDCIIRYEWRGQKLKDEGKFETVITHDAHYMPVVYSLLGS